MLISTFVDGFPPSSIAGWFLLGMAFLFVSGLLSPQLMIGPYRLVDKLFGPVGRLFAFVVLAVVYFGVFTPFSLVLRLLHWDPLRLRRTNWPASGWVTRSEQTLATNYRWQY